MSRVDAVKVAVLEGRRRARCGQSVAASDAFFPFRDGLDALAAAGATAVVQPGGSVRDAEVIAAADEHGLAMVFTGRTAFQALNRCRRRSTVLAVLLALAIVPVFRRARRLGDLGRQRGVLRRDAARDDGARRLPHPDVQLPAAVQQAGPELLDRRRRSTTCSACRSACSAWRSRSARMVIIALRALVLGRIAAQPSSGRGPDDERPARLRCGPRSASRPTAAAADVRPAHLHRHLDHRLHVADAGVLRAERSAIPSGGGCSSC